MKKDNSEVALQTKVESLEDHPALDSRKPHMLGLLTIGLIFGLFGLWAILAKVDTSVVGSGKVISKGYKKSVAHPKGGLVTNIYVKEGDYVRKGSPLLELDNSKIESELENAVKQHDTLLIQSARLEAEAALSKSPDFEAVKSGLIDLNSSVETIEQEKRLLGAELKTLDLKVSLLKEKNEILKQQIEGLEERISSNEKIMRSYEKELKKWQSLYDRNMTDEMKLLDRERKIEQIRADIADAKSRIGEYRKRIDANMNQMELEKASFEQNARMQLKDIELKIVMLENKIKSLGVEKEHMLLKAPDSGTVTSMMVHAVGEVIPPQKPIAFVVPTKNALMLELMVNPTDIDKVHLGQKADIHFPSYVDPGALPIEGNVTYVSADTFLPPGAKSSFYKILLEITPAGMEAIRENGFDIVPGMPASAYIKAGKRSFMSYILSPLESLLKRAFHAN